MQPLIDFDVLTYEIGFACEVGWKANNDSGDPPPFDYAAELLDNRIAHICQQVGATAPPIGYLTGKGNFREKIAVTKPYKGNRKQDKPFHYHNLRAYMVGKYNAIVVEGREADDAMAIEQVKHLRMQEGNPLYKHTTIICTRDKDLRMVPGWHYGWELGGQPSFGPELVDEIGYLKLEGKKLRGVGMKFFYAQCLMGDNVDNIQGIPKCGPQKAYKLLVDTQTPTEMFEAVREAYKGFYGDEWEKHLLENGQLLWMVRELDEDGNPVMWRFPDVL